MSLKQVYPCNIQDELSNSSFRCRADPVGCEGVDNDACGHYSHLSCQVLQKPMAEVTSWPTRPNSTRKPARFKGKTCLVKLHEMESNTYGS